MLDFVHQLCEEKNKGCGIELVGRVGILGCILICCVPVTSVLSIDNRCHILLAYLADFCVVGCFLATFYFFGGWTA